MPLVRRVPKRGFTNPNRVNWSEVNIEQLAVRFEAGSVVDVQALRDVGLVKGRDPQVVVLGRGELEVALEVKVHRFSGTAASKIAAAGGSAEVVA